MSEWNPKAVWGRVCRTVKNWMSEDEDSDAADPDLLFHLVVTTPILFGVLAVMRRL
jgi:hypothetical protein